MQAQWGHLVLISGRERRKCLCWSFSSSITFSLKYIGNIFYEIHKSRINILQLKMGLVLVLLTWGNLIGWKQFSSKRSFNEDDNRVEKKKLKDNMYITVHE